MTMTTDAIIAQTDELSGVLRSFGKQKIKASQTPATRALAAERKKVVAAYEAIKCNVAIVATVADIAEKIGFEAWPHSAHILRGAMLSILDSASDPAAVQRYKERDEAYRAQKRRKTSGLRAIVSVAVPSAALEFAAKGMRLRRQAMDGEFTGRGDPGDLAELGRVFNCSVRVEVDKEQLDLVKNGVVDETLLACLLNDAPDAGRLAAETSEKARSTVVRGERKDIQADLALPAEGESQGPQELSAEKQAAVDRAKTAERKDGTDLDPAASKERYLGRPSLRTAGQ